MRRLLWIFFWLCGELRRYIDRCEVDKPFFEVNKLINFEKFLTKFLDFFVSIRKWHFWSCKVFSGHFDYRSNQRSKPTDTQHNLKLFPSFSSSWFKRDRKKIFEDDWDQLNGFCGCAVCWETFFIVLLYFYLPVCFMIVSRVKSFRNF